MPVCSAKKYLVLGTRQLNSNTLQTVFQSYSQLAASQLEFLVNDHGFTFKGETYSEERGSKHLILLYEKESIQISAEYEPVSYPYIRILDPSSSGAGLYFILQLGLPEMLEPLNKIRNRTKELNSLLNNSFEEYQKKWYSILETEATQEMSQLLKLQVDFLKSHLEILSGDYSVFAGTSPVF